MLLAPAGDRAPQRRDAAWALLEGRGWGVHDADHPLGALAELCLLDRTRTMREAWGLQPVEALALVVSDPAAWPDDLPEMLAAAARYVPQATLWTYDGGELHALDAGGRDADARPAAAPAPQAPAQRAGADEAFAPPLISGDEIAMLLEGEPREPAP